MEIGSWNRDCFLAALELGCQCRDCLRRKVDCLRPNLIVLRGDFLELVFGRLFLEIVFWSLVLGRLFLGNNSDCFQGPGFGRLFLEIVFRAMVSGRLFLEIVFGSLLLRRLF